MYESVDLSKIEERCMQLLNSPYLRREVPPELKNLRGVLQSMGTLIKDELPSLIAEVKRLRSRIRKMEEELATLRANSTVNAPK